MDPLGPVAPGPHEPTPQPQPSTGTRKGGPVIPRRKRYAAPVKGTNLYVDIRTGNYVWRRRNEATGARIKRSTKTKNLTYALQLAAGFEDDFQKKRAGLKVYDAWRLPLGPLAEKWIESLDSKASRRKARQQITRALDLLKLQTPADLDDLGRLDAALRALEMRPDDDEDEDAGPRFGRLTLLRCFQKPLRQFSRWLGSNRRYLDRDPLATWKLLDIRGVQRRDRRALMPEEFARALWAAEQIDALVGRRFPLRPVLVALLVSAARVGSVMELDEGGLDRERQRLDLGADVGNKRRGEAALDASTFRELAAYVDERGEDRENEGESVERPFFPSPRGKRLTEPNLIDDWREAFGLGLVDELWPATEPRDVVLQYHVSLHLLRGRSTLGSGGNPKLLKPETVAARAHFSQRVRRLAEKLRATWTTRMVGIDLHALRKTHQTWAEAKGVHPILIDKQLGHSTPGGGAALEAARTLLASPVGRKHYVDMGVALLDARRSAEAVRELMDDAVARLAASRAGEPARPGEGAPGQVRRA